MVVAPATRAPWIAEMPTPPHPNWIVGIPLRFADCVQALAPLVLYQVSMSPV